MSLLDMEVHTFSVVAWCRDTKRVGAAACSGRPFVGALLPLVASQEAAIASQALASPVLARKILTGLGTRMGITRAAETALQNDPGREKRQVSAVDSEGDCYGFTGSENLPFAGHIPGEHFVVAGNMLAGPEVLQAMATAFQASTGNEVELAERLLATLEAASQLACADVRGKVSAVLQVGDDDLSAYVDIRVDEHPSPVGELRRLFEVWKATQREYQKVMPTRSNPAGSLDGEAIRRARSAFQEYQSR